MPSDSPAELAPGREIVSRFHELTKNGPIEADRSSLLAFAPADPTNRPAAFKRYLGLETHPLPRDVGVSGERAVDALAGGPPSGRYRFDARLLARLLFHSAGVT
ncbi:MAG: hypothetical protein ACRDV9_13355, partial [Acidimicrobiia bacterium]